jgi:hypothetical protein
MTKKEKRVRGEMSNKGSLTITGFPVPLFPSSPIPLALA